MNNEVALSIVHLSMFKVTHSTMKIKRSHIIRANGYYYNSDPDIVKFKVKGL